MNRIIVNADDLGYSMSVNQAIEKAIDAGVVTSASIMTNMSTEALNDAIRMTRQYKDVSFGIHLNLTEGSPLTVSNYMLKKGLLLQEEDGLIFNGLLFRRRYINNILRGEIYKEFDAQIKRLESMGVKPSHIDSHHHIHTELFVLPVVVRLAKVHHIEKIRIVRNIGTSGLDRFCRILWRIYLSLLYKDVRTVDYFDSYSSFLQNRVKDGVDIELMCHPGGKLLYREEEDLLYSHPVFPYNKAISYHSL